MMLSFGGRSPAPLTPHLGEQTRSHWSKHRLVEFLWTEQFLITTTKLTGQCKDISRLPPTFGRLHVLLSQATTVCAQPPLSLALSLSLPPSLPPLTNHGLRPDRSGRGAARRRATRNPFQHSRPLSNEEGTYKTVTARFWPWRSSKSL